jgi:hypothetical protein
MEMSACQQLDLAGQQPHSREYLEYCVMRDRSDWKAMHVPGVVSMENKFDELSNVDMDYIIAEGIQYSGQP